MPSDTTLSNRLIAQLAPSLSDHARVLADLADSLKGEQGALVEAWDHALAQTQTESLSPDKVDAARPLLWDGTKILPDAFAAQNDSARENSLRGWVNWNKELEQRGFNFVDRILLLSAFHRVLLPKLVTRFEAGPELQLAFAALDASDSLLLALAAASEIETAQKRLLEGAHARSVARLTGGITHSLNNMLAVIIGRAQLLEEEVLDEHARTELRAIQTSARAGADNLRRLQQYSLVREAQPRVPLDINSVINDVVKLTRFRWRDDAEASGIVIDVVQDLAPVPPILGHAGLLRDALVELILNSIEAMPLGGLVTVRTERLGDQVAIAVTDLGEGMDEATRVRAHEPFFTTKGAGHVGLGLASVKTIAQQHGGTFTLTSRAGQDTTATLMFPVALVPQEAGEPRLARLARWANVLIVDDEEMVRQVAERALASRGFRTMAADSGTEALRLFREEGPFEVVLVDLGMPGMNGFELARELKKENPRTVIILVTGWASELDPKKLREAGIDRTLTKPFDVEQMIQLVSEAMAVRENL